MEELEMMQNEEEVVVEQEEVEQENDSTATEGEGETAQKQDVPLDTFLYEKRRRKEVEKELNKLKEERMSNDRVQKIDKVRNMAKEKGYDDDLADLLGNLADELYSSIPKSSGKSEDDFLLEDIRDAQDYRGLKDAVKYKDQIIARVKKNGLSIEEAYQLEVGNKTRELLSERRTQDEQVAAMKRRQASGDKAISVASDTAKTNLTLTAEEKKEFDAMKKMRPERELTIEKFKKLRSMYT